MTDHTVAALEYSDVMSRMVQERYPQYSKKHGCYENVYQMLSVVKELRRYHLQAMFCYITLGGQACILHCRRNDCRTAAAALV